MKISKSGFTIVELLIVIVVIAILAAISIVAYNGIQERAKVSQQLNALSQYAKAFSLYTADRGVYPYQPAGNGQQACIHPTTNCFSSWDTNLTTTLRTNIQAYIGATPAFNETVLITQNASVGGTYSGIYFYVHFPASLASCPSVSGLTLINRTAGNPTICRYYPPTAG